jgi:hypothetical protein
MKNYLDFEYAVYAFKFSYEEPMNIGIRKSAIKIGSTHCLRTRPKQICRELARRNAAINVEIDLNSMVFILVPNQDKAIKTERELRGIKDFPKLKTLGRDYRDLQSLVKVEAAAQGLANILGFMFFRCVDFPRMDDFVPRPLSLQKRILQKRMPRDINCYSNTFDGQQLNSYQALFIKAKDILHELLPYACPGTYSHRFIVEVNSITRPIIQKLSLVCALKFLDETENKLWEVLVLTERDGNALLFNGGTTELIIGIRPPPGLGTGFVPKSIKSFKDELQAILAKAPKGRLKYQLSP